MSKYYTGSGDDGFTQLLGEGRVAKYHPKPEALGALDEASAALGVARASCGDPRSAALLLETQRDLYRLMAEVAAAPENAVHFRTIDANRVAWLESQINRLGETVEMPREFILPGDSSAGAALSLARAIVRRAERRVARLLHDHEIENPALLHYLNRLSSLCFLLELLENRAAGVSSPTVAKDQ